MRFPPTAQIVDHAKDWVSTRAVVYRWIATLLRTVTGTPPIVLRDLRGWMTGIAATPLLPLPGWMLRLEEIPLRSRWLV